MGFLMVLMGVIFASAIHASNPTTVNFILGSLVITCFLSGVYLEVKK